MKFYRIMVLLLPLSWATGVCAVLNQSAAYQAAVEAQAAGNYTKAYTLYLRVAEVEHNPLAYFNLGLFERNGWGRASRPVAACHWFGKAARGAIPYAQHLYGECLEQGTHQAANPTAAAHWYQEAAKGGYVLSRCYLGRLYMQGVGVEKDPQKGLQLCNSAVTGSSMAMVWMGSLLLEGDESVRNYNQAVRWFEQAAQYKLSEAFYYLGQMSERGLASGLLPEQALGFYRQAASMGYAPAYLPTGRLYFYAPPDAETGFLSPENLAKAYMWLSAARQSVTREPQLEEVNSLLSQVNAVMPQSWHAELDAKVEHHLQEVASR